MLKKSIFSVKWARRAGDSYQFLIFTKSSASPNQSRRTKQPLGYMYYAGKIVTPINIHHPIPRSLQAQRTAEHQPTWLISDILTMFLDKIGIARLPRGRSLGFSPITGYQLSQDLGSVIGTGVTRPNTSVGWGSDRYFFNGFGMDCRWKWNFKEGRTKTKSEWMNEWRMYDTRIQYPVGWMIWFFVRSLFSHLFSI